VEFDAKLVLRFREVLSSLGSVGEKPAFHYWTKKPLEVAEALILEFLVDGGVLLDPFLGSGSSLLAFRNAGRPGTFIGVDVNQLPLEISALQVDPSYASRIENAYRRIELFCATNDPFSRLEEASGTGLKFVRATVNIDAGNPEVTALQFGESRSEKQILQEGHSRFGNAREEYLSLWRAACGPFARNHELTPNSRIAAKDGTFVSDLFSPIAFRFLLEYSERFKEDLDAMLVLSACLHHCKLTDRGTQSQFPFWFPKKEAIDRNTGLTIKKKAFELLRNSSRERIRVLPVSRKQSIPTDPDNKLLNYVLLEKGIQKITDAEIPSSSVDLVITDPPYFDQVAYSEYLAMWEFFTGLRSNLEHEIIESNRKTDARTRTRYLQDLSNAFVNVRRMVKDSAPLFLYFKDSKPQNVSDFVKTLSTVGFKFIAQTHLSADRRTYKQNSSPESTVSGDCLMLFVATEPQVTMPADRSSISESGSAERLIRSYLKVNGPSSLGEIYDNVLIPSLLQSGELEHFQSQEQIFKILEKFTRRSDQRYEA